MNKLIVLIVLIATLAFLIIQQFFTPLFQLPISRPIYFFQIWFPLLTISSHSMLRTILKKGNSHRFVRMFMLSMTLRMFASVLVLVVALFTLEKVHIRPAIFVFAVLYLIYFLIDILALLRLLKQNKV